MFVLSPAPSSSTAPTFRNVPAAAANQPATSKVALGADGTLPQGEISLSLVDDGAGVRIVVEDNGKGLPKEGRERLTEPYMTTRSKGTGLGLAIVKKIMEDHGGYLALDDREGGGARISLVFRRDAKEIASVRAHATAAQ